MLLWGSVMVCSLDFVDNIRKRLGSEGLVHNFAGLLGGDLSWAICAAADEVQ